MSNFWPFRLLILAPPYGNGLEYVQPIVPDTSPPITHVLETIQEDDVVTDTTSSTIEQVAVIQQATHRETQVLLKPSFLERDIMSPKLC